MLNTNFTNIRDIQRNYKGVAREVNRTDKPLVVMSKNEPQFAIISLRALERIEKATTRNAAQKLLKLAEWAEKQQFNLPHDLSEKHNEYTWDE